MSRFDKLIINEKNERTERRYRLTKQNLKYLFLSFYYITDSSFVSICLFFL